MSAAYGIPVFEYAGQKHHQASEIDSQECPQLLIREISD